MSDRSRREDDGVVYRTFDVDEADPNVSVARTVAELENVETEELTPLYGCIDHILEHVFSDPPVPAAEAQITFSYEGYRITVEQDGNAVFRKQGGRE
ncbi:HalOD1 output domain-containing protein [Natronococcus roseus]|uniref:HalOD1 output domain-containing protein n=1 Tax=Natronococcus roseus TaxID=1052014 RepID=UPI00374DCA72